MTLQLGAATHKLELQKSSTQRTKRSHRLDIPKTKRLGTTGIQSNKEQEMGFLTEKQSRVLLRVLKLEKQGRAMKAEYIFN